MIFFVGSRKKVRYAVDVKGFSGARDIRDRSLSAGRTYAKAILNSLGLSLVRM